MSFNFSDDDDDDLDLDAFDDTGLLALASRERAENEKPPEVEVDAAALPPAPAAANTSAKGKDGADESNVNDFYNDDSDDGGDWDNIDWEDADQEEDGDEDDHAGDDALPTSSFPSQGVMINFGKTAGKSNDPDEGIEEKKDEGNEEEEASSKKRKRKVTRVLRNVPHETRQMVLNVRRSQMLCSIVHCMQCSFTCGGGNTDGIYDNQRLLSHVAYSLIPQEFHRAESTTTNASIQKSSGKSTVSTIPTRNQLRKFTQWYCQFVNQAGRRRRNALQRNVARGAASLPRRSRRSGRTRSSAKNNANAKKQSPNKNAKNAESNTNKSFHTQNNEEPAFNTPQSELSPLNLLRTLMHLSPHYDEDPQLFLEEEGMDAIDAVERISARDKVLLFLAMVRTLGWRARYVTSLNPAPLELTVDHPLLVFKSKFKSQSMSTTSLDVKPSARKTQADNDQLHKLLCLMNERGMLNHNGDAGSHGRKRKRRRTKQKNDANAATAKDTIELLSSGDENETSGNKSNSSKPSSAHNAIPQTSPHDLDHGLLSWVEVICRSDGGDKRSMSPTKPVARWVSIHPEQESFDMPEEVESILAWTEMYGNANSDKQDASDTLPKGTWNKKGKWTKSPNQRNANKYARKSPVSYVLAVEHLPLKAGAPHPNNGNSIQSQGVRFADVTPRYANTWSRTLRLRGASGREISAGGGRCVDEWWGASLQEINRHCRPKRQRDKSLTKTKSPVRSVTKRKTNDGQEVDLVELESSDDDKRNIGIHSDESDSDEHEFIEAKELAGGLEKEKIPTSKKGFKESPFYAIPSVLNSQDVLHPEARKRICGVFKGELVYPRSDVSKALRAKRWMYQGRKVRNSELDNPVKQVKARKKPVAKGFQALTSYGVSEEAQNELISSMNKKKAGEEVDGMWNLYGIWQTDPWSPPYVGPTDIIPTNEYRNVELALINPGLTHMQQPRLSSIAKKLGIPYAPCMLGYEGHGGNRAPTIRGIVVHDHDVALLREAYVEWESHAAEKERMDRRNEILKRWKRLVVGMLTKDRLEREYG